MSRTKNDKIKRVVSVFSSFEEENRAERRRLSALSPAERLQEFATLQQRAWGSKWTRSRIPHIVKVERTAW